MNVDVAVIGGGIAGCFAAWELLATGRSVCVMDSPQPGSATPVAAGLYNPIRFRDLAEVDEAVPLVALVRRRLAEIEQATGTALDVPNGIARLFGDAAARKRWEELAESSEIMGPVIEGDELPPEIRAPYGGGLTEHSGCVEPELLQSVLHDYYRARGALLEQRLGPEDLELGGGDTALRVGDVKAQALVLCQGAGAASAPLLPGPQIDTLRGEVLRVRIAGLSLNRPLHRGVYLVPRSDGSFVVGSTYERGTRELEPTAAAREALLKRLSKLTAADVKLLDQQVGLRPISSDGLPVVGLIRPRVALVNGLGPKGVLYAPAAAAVAAYALGIEPRSEADAAPVLPVQKLARQWRPDRATS